jgi:4-hydroxybenzoate polyprenyltransferase
MINLREMIKDIEDIKEMIINGMRTLPIVVGLANSTNSVFALSFIPIIALVLCE